MRIIAVFILLFPGSQALAEVSGSISCVVKSNTVVSISEDVTKKYTGFKDRFEVWDKLIFEYSGVRLPFDRPQTSLFCGLKDKITIDAVISAMHHTGYSLEGDAKIYSDGRVVLLRKFLWR